MKQLFAVKNITTGNIVGSFDTKVAAKRTRDHLNISSSHTFTITKGKDYKEVGVIRTSSIHPNKKGLFK